MKEIIINITSLEIRVATLEEGDLVDFLVEREQSRRLVGDIYLGKVNAIIPGIQAAFVDIGFEKAGFLHASDLYSTSDALRDFDILEAPKGKGMDTGDNRDSQDSQEKPESRDHRNRRDSRDSREKNGHPPIEKVLTKGQQLLVQVTKEAIGTKGPRLSTQVSLPGRYVVYVPNSDYLGVSRRIESRQERARLKNLISKKKPPNTAIIARTACVGVDPKHIVSDINYLHKMWQEVRSRSEKATAPLVIHEEVGLLIGMVRDVMTSDVDRILIDNDREYQKLQQYLRTFSPELAPRVKLYKDRTPIFDKFNIEREIEKTLERKIWLKKGGYIVIDPTEALVAIDVNTGRFVGKKDQEETIFETNMLAAREIPRQLRLRDIGGIIVIDFIDMEKEIHRRKVLAELRQSLRKDRARSKAFTVSELGLVEVSRKRVRPSLLHFFSDECPYCKGTGKVLSFDSLSNKIEQWIRRVGSRTNEKRIQLRVNSSLALYLEDERRQILDAMERQYKFKIEIQDDPRLHREDFKLVSLSSFKDLMQEAT